MKINSRHGKRIGFCALGGAVVVAAALAPAYGEGTSAGATSAAGSGAMAARLIGAAMSDGRAYQLAQSLTDGVGARPSGSEGAARAVKWAVDKMRTLGLKNVHTEAVRVPRWIRGAAEAEVIAPARQTMHVVALGPSVPTGPDGITAEVVAVSSYEELKALGDGARGKIVLFNPKGMQRGRSFEEYGRAVAFRGGGAVAAAKQGAVAALVRSAGTGAYRLPHTGAMHYDDGTPKIPAAALAVEDAELIKRLINSGQHVRIRLVLTPKFDGEVESANVVGEVPGRDRASELVLLGAHLDSWDLATGAVDDAAGCAIVMDAARIIAAIGRAPRRTVRVVLFMNEEMGLSGARAYAQQHAAELGKHAAALEVDSGEGRPSGFGVVGSGSGGAGVALLKQIIAPLESFGAATVIETPEAGADLMPMSGKVPLFTIEQDLTTYFDWHHTAADTFDKLDAMDMALNTAAIAVAAYGLAESGDKLPVSPPSRRMGQPPMSPAAVTK
ncbi:MAG: M20/M25/M40 family metallo-hydrolase [Polyangia bacterium]